jgi:hypothetical protein
VLEFLLLMRGLVYWFEVVQSRDLSSAMRSALTTRGLAECASLILKTVSMIIMFVRFLGR